MADKAISDLTAATQVTSADLFVLEQNNTAKKLTGQILMNDLATALDGHGGINSIVYTDPVAPSLTGTLTITLADDTVYTLDVENGNGIASITQYWAISDDNTDAPAVWYTTLQTMTASYRYLWSYTNIAFDDGTDLDTTPQVIGVYGDQGDSWYVHIKYAGVYPTQDADMGDTPDEYVGVYSGTSSTAPTHYTDYTWYGWKGPRGLTGNSIASVEKTGTSGLVDTYTVTFTDGNTATFTVTNGSNISTIAKTGTSGLQDTYTVTLTNGQTTTFNVNNGKSITSIAWTSSDKGNIPRISGATDTYTISYNDQDTSTFSVYNGLDGTGANISVDGIASSAGNVDLLTIGNSAPTQYTQGNTKSRYFDATDSILYICVGYDPDTGAYDWRGAGVTVDAAMSTSSTNPLQNKVITNKIGTGTLNTVAQNLVGAVNEHDAEIGDVSQLTTTATDLVGAVNEVDSEKVSKTGDTMSGDLTVSANVVVQTVNQDGVTPASNVYDNALRVVDANGQVVGFLAPYWGTNGRQSIALRCRRVINNIEYLNNVALGVEPNGDSYVALTAPNAWRNAIGAVNIAGDTMTGDLIVEGAYIRPKSTNLTQNTTVSSTQGGNARLFFRDSQGTALGCVYPYFHTNGKEGLRLFYDRVIGSSEIINALEIGVDQNGEHFVEVGSAANAWMGALATATPTITTTISDVATAASGYTINAVKFAKWGRMANLYIQITKTAAVTSDTNMSMATLKSGYRPTEARCPLMGESGTINFGSITEAGTIIANGTWAANASKIFVATYILA